MLSSSRAVTAAGLLAVPSVKIQPREGWTSLGLMEVWEHRELLYFLVWRNVKVRYKQTALGAAWAILQPVLGMLIFTLFFGRLARLPSDGIPYPLFTFAALVPWTSFINALTDSSNSLVGSANLISKVYFPRMIVPASSIVTSLVDFAVSFGLMLLLMVFYTKYTFLSQKVQIYLLKIQEDERIYRNMSRRNLQKIELLKLKIK